MKKKQLEILLERMEGFRNPVPELEQYATPACVAAEMLYLAYMHGDLGVVCDLGCGTGMLAVGAALLGAKAIGVEVDTQALSVARRNADKMGVEVDFIQGDINQLALKAFGAQRASHGDRAFLRKAVKTARVVYSLHNRGSEGFIRRFVEPCQIVEIYLIPFRMKRCFEFHSKEVKTFEVELYRIACQQQT